MREENDLIEMEKLTTCTQLVANAVMLSTVLYVQPFTGSWRT
jgi:hypothetical protein